METGLTWRGTMAAGVFAAGAFAGASDGQAAACVAGGLPSYISGGAAPCTIGELTFSNFAYDQGTSFFSAGTFDVSEASGRLALDMYFSVYAPTFATVSFTVTAPTGRIITAITNQITGEMLVDAGIGEGRAAASNGTTVQAAQNFPDGTAYGVPFDVSNSASFAGVNSLDIAYQISGEGIIIYTALLGFTVADAPRVTDVPEPGTLALFGVGLTGLAALRARRRARHADVVAY